MRAKAFMVETQAARARGELLERKLVELLAGYLLTVLQQRILAVPRRRGGRGCGDGGCARRGAGVARDGVGVVGGAHG